MCASSSSASLRSPRYLSCGPAVVSILANYNWTGRLRAGGEGIGVEQGLEVHPLCVRVVTPLAGEGVADVDLDLHIRPPKEERPKPIERTAAVQHLDDNFDVRIVEEPEVAGARTLRVVQQKGLSRPAVAVGGPPRTRNLETRSEKAHRFVVVETRGDRASQWGRLDRSELRGEVRNPRVQVADDLGTECALCGSTTARHHRPCTVGVAHPAVVLIGGALMSQGDTMSNLVRQQPSVSGGGCLVLQKWSQVDDRSGSVARFPVLAGSGRSGDSAGDPLADEEHPHCTVTGPDGLVPVVVEVEISGFRIRSPLHPRKGETKKRPTIFMDSVHRRGNRFDLVPHGILAIGHDEIIRVCGNEGEVLDLSSGNGSGRPPPVHDLDLEIAEEVDLLPEGRGGRHQNGGEKDQLAHDALLSSRTALSRRHGCSRQDCRVKKLRT